jgi:hypothetical protein
VNVFRGIVSVGSDDGLIDHLTLVRDRQTVLRCKLTELFVGEAHKLLDKNNYKTIENGVNPESFVDLEGGGFAGRTGCYSATRNPGLLRVWRQQEERFFM